MLNHPIKSKIEHALACEGIAFDQDKWLESNCRTEKLAKQSAILAQRLWDAGDSKIFRQSHEWIHFVGSDGTARLYEGSMYANRNVIPVKMAENSRRYVKTLLRWLEAHPYARMMVITHGKNIPLESLKVEKRKFIKNIRKKLRPLLKHTYGASIDWERVEFTIKRIDGSAWLHLHCHMLYVPPYISDFGKLMKDVRETMGSHCWDSGKVTNPAELAKYVCKIESDKNPENIGLLDLTPYELRTLAEQTYNQRYLTPLGNLQAWMRELKERKTTLKKYYDSHNETWRWCEVEQDDSLGCEVEYQEESKSPPCNIVLGWKVGAFTTPTMRKHLIVMGYSGDFAQFLQHRGLTPESFQILSSHTHDKCPHASSYVDPISGKEVPEHWKPPPKPPDCVDWETENVIDLKSGQAIKA